MTDNLDPQAVYNHLANSFDADDIVILAYDYFETSYRRFDGVLSKTQIIRTLVVDAESRRRLSELGQLLSNHPDSTMTAPDRQPSLTTTRTPPVQPPLSAHQQQRLKDIERHITEHQRLLADYETARLMESDPRRIANYEANIKREKASIEQYLNEAAQLGGLSAQAEPPITSRADQGQPEADPQPAEAQSHDDLEAFDETSQPWYAPGFPTIKEIEPVKARALRNQIDVVLMTATDTELRAVMHRLDPYPRRGAILVAYLGPETYYLGKFGAWNAVVTKCRMGAGGESGSTLSTQSALNEWQPRAIIMVGIAFGKDPAKQKMADVLVASQIIPYEKQRVGEKIIFRDPIPPSNTILLNRFENALGWSFLGPDGQPVQRRIGPILSGEKLADNWDFKEALFTPFPQAIGGEMEGAGLAAAAGRVGVAWILVKAICDWADGRKHDNYQPLAAAAATSLVHYVLSRKAVLDSIAKPT